MNVGELKAALADHPDNLMVVLAKDGEGNAFYPLDSHDTGRYSGREVWPDDEDFGGVRCLTLWPA